ncbi:MAG: P1 family peptidase [Tepidisphaeraceae bacterium]
MATTSSARPARRARDLGVRIGVLPVGRWNAITDVAAVLVGRTTLIEGDAIRTGVTAIIPADGNLFQRKVPAAVYAGNGFGKLAGSTQIDELGTIETPIVLTNTLSVAVAIDALVDHALAAPGNESVRSVNALVGETNDGYLNDVRGRHVRKEHVRAAIDGARGDGPVEEGCVGAGTGTVCFGFKGGIGSASRVLPGKLGGYTVGVLVQTNFGGVLQIDGVPIGKELGRFMFSDKLGDVDGSCMIVVATDAPLDARNLKRLAKRAFLGIARTGGIASNGSGDYAIAFSTAPSLRVEHQPRSPLRTVELLHDDFVSPLFLAAIEATEEAIVNALFTADTMTGIDGRRVDAMPRETVLDILRKHNRIHP